MAFFITTPRKPSLGDLLGKGLGTGLAKGTEMGLSSYLKAIQQQKKLSEALTKQRQQSQAGFGKYAKNVLGKDWWEEISPEKKMEYEGLVGKFFDQYKDPILAQRAAADAILREDEDVLERIGGPSLRKDLTQTQKLSPVREGLISGIEGPSLGKELTQTQKLSPVREGLRPGIEEIPKEFYKGTQASVAGKLAKLITEGGYNPEQLMAEIEKNPSFAAQLARTIGTGVADLPLYIAGASLGGPVGMVALPTFASATADEVAKALSSKDKMTLAKGGEAGLRIAEKTAKGGLLGGILGKIPGLSAFLKKFPIGERLLRNYTAEKLLETGAATAALTAVDPLLEGRKPTGQDFANALTTTMAFELINLPSSSRKYIQGKLNKIKDVVKNPTEFAKQTFEKFKELGGSEEELSAGKPSQVKLLNKSLNEVQKRAETVKERTLKEKTPTYKEREALEGRISEKKRQAGILKEKPLEEWMKPRELPKKEQKLVNERNQLRSDIETTQRQLDQVAEIKAKPGKPARNVEIAEKALNDQLNRQEAQLKEVSEKLSAARDKRTEQIEKRRKAVETQDLQKSINEHVKRLEEAAEKPGGMKDAEIQKLFDRDQKYINEANELMKSGELPDKFVTDTGIKILERYNKAYSEMLSNLNKFLENTKNVKEKETLAKRKKAQELKKRLERNKSINDAKLVRRKQKRFAKEALKGPGKAFMKKYLKDIGAQSKMLEGDLFRYRKDFSALEKKVEDIKTETFKKNIENKNFQELSEQTGIPIEEINKLYNEGREAANKTAIEIKEGKPIDKALSPFRKALQKYKNLPRLPRALFSGILFGELQDAIDKITGIRPSTSFLSLLMPKRAAPFRFGAFVVSNVYRQIKKAIKKGIYKKQYNNLRTARERADFLKKLRKEGVGTKALKEIRGR